MAFVSAVVTTKSFMVANLQRIDGTWVTTGVTKGTIDLTSYISEIYIGVCNSVSGTGLVHWGTNRTDASATTVAAGQIAILAATDADVGQYMAIGPKA